MKFKLFSFLINAPDENSRGSGRTSPFHAPPKPGELTTLTTGLREATGEKNDPAIGLLETLHAVKDKQHGGQSGTPADRNLDDISGVQSEQSPLQRLLSTQVVVFGSVALVLVLSIWGMIVLARKATENVPAEAIAEKNQRTTEKTTEPAEAPPPPPPSAATPPPTTLARPQFRSESLGTPSDKVPSAIQIQLEKERIAREERERMEREKQREEEEKQERERQLRELEGRDQNPESPSSAPPPPNGAEVATPPPDEAPNQAPPTE
jgi:hypothetical protein